MTTPTPSLNMADLLARYLQRQAEAADAGLGYPDLGEATPYDTTPVQPIDPRLAWQDAVAVGQLFAVPKTTWSVPPAWPTLTTQQEPALAIAFCLGNYPQLVRNLQPLLTGELAELRHEFASSRPVSVSSLASLHEWASQADSDPARLLAAGVLRLAGHFDQAAEVLAAVGGPEWSAIRDNELAAFDWHRGNREQALAAWSTQSDSPAVLFNRGMAALFVGDADRAADALSAASATLPETSAWYHLAQLYLAFTQK